MSNKYFDNNQWKKSLVVYDKWLKEQNVDAHKMWYKRMKSTNPPKVEGAVAEAVAWDYLSSRLSNPSLSDKPGSGGPDFKFGDNKKSIYVEVTNLSKELVSKKTGLSNMPTNFKCYWFGLLTQIVKRKVISKAGQLKDIGSPQILFVTTLHFQASAFLVERKHLENLLTSDPKIAIPISPQEYSSGDDPYQIIDFEHSIFTCSKSLITSRSHLSAVLVGGFGVMTKDVQVFGLLNPNPLYPIEIRDFIDVPFCQFRTWPPDKQVDLVWSDSYLNNQG